MSSSFRVIGAIAGLAFVVTVIGAVLAVVLVLSIVTAASTALF